MIRSRKLATSIPAISVDVLESSVLEKTFRVKAPEEKVFSVGSGEVPM